MYKSATEADLDKAAEILQSKRNSNGSVRTSPALSTIGMWVEPKSYLYHMAQWHFISATIRIRFGFFIAIRCSTLGSFLACNLCLISNAQIFSSSPYLLNCPPHRLGTSNCPSHPPTPLHLSGVSSALVKLKPIRWHSLSTFFRGHLGSADSVRICFQGHFCCGSAGESQLASCC